MSGSEISTASDIRGLPAPGTKQVLLGTKYVFAPPNPWSGIETLPKNVCTTNNLAPGVTTPQTPDPMLRHW